MTSLVATAAVAPLRAEPSVRAEQVTQLLFGEAASLLAAEGSWCRVRTADVGYEAWVHGGYVRELSDDAGAEWRAVATAWADGVVVEEGGSAVRLPWGARVRAIESVDGGHARVALPDGRVGVITEGQVRSAADLAREACAMPAEQWALERFGGAPYQWGGRTPWGVDCSGLVQATFAARGVQLPRDSGQQVAAGAPVPLDAMRSGDLLFFRSESGRDTITHIAFLAPDDTLVHSTIDRGGVLREPWGPGTRAHLLRERLVAVRRV